MEMAVVAEPAMTSDSLIPGSSPGTASRKGDGGTSKARMDWSPAKELCWSIITSNAPTDLLQVQPEITLIRRAA